MLIVKDCLTDLIENEFVVIFESDNLIEIIAEGEGLSIFANKEQDLFTLRLSIDIFNNKYVILKSEGKVIINAYHCTTLTSNIVDFSNCSFNTFSDHNLIFSCEAYTMGEVTMIGDNYDRGLNDGLILGKMI